MHKEWTVCKIYNLFVAADLIFKCCPEMQILVYPGYFQTWFYEWDDKDTRKLLRLDKNNRSLPLQDITRKFNENREDVVSSVTVRRCLYRKNFHRRVVRKHIRIREANVRGRLAWARGKRYWTVERDWSRVIFSDECKIIVGENNRVFVWRKPGEEWLPQCLSPGCKAKMSLMIWGCIIFNGNINAAK